MPGPFWRHVLCTLLRHTLCRIGIHPMRWDTVANTKWCPACQRHVVGTPDPTIWPKAKEP